MGREMVMGQVRYHGFPSHERTVFGIACRRYGVIPDDFNVSATEGIGASTSRTPRVVTVERKALRMSMYEGEPGVLVCRV
ncbi:hypothetical protein CS8_009850 [Cupriavidus sp. 8B]